MLRIGIVVGEPSGDQLGAGFVNALRSQNYECDIEGILGPRLIAAGGHAIFPMERLAVMGLVEVVGRYLELTSIRNRIKHHFLRNPPDVFVGIDAPDFNLGLETSLRKAGIKTVHYVSPTIWAWRPGRTNKVASAADKLLTLFPFEKEHYQGCQLDVEYVGHPFADQIPFHVDKDRAREYLSLPKDKTIIALMPGSRFSELERHTQPFLKTALLCHHWSGELHFVTNQISNAARAYFLKQMKQFAPELPISVFAERSRDVLQTCDVALLASGTITLEAMLQKKPMVVAYKVSSLSYHVLRRLIRSKWISLPNILARSALVPEYYQTNVKPEILAPALMHWLDDRQARGELLREFELLHKYMQRGADNRVAAAIAAMCRP